MISYSQSCTQQDRFVLDRFADLGNAGRYYVEIGAHDGVRHSNTKMLEEYYGWRGLLVEPNPELFEQLNANRPGNQLSSFAISDQSCASADFWLGGSYGGLVEHMPSDFHKEHKSRGTKQTRVSCITLEELFLINTCPRFIDYLSLDVEGAEYAILESYYRERATKRSFGIITVEFRYDKCLLDRLQVLLHDEYELEHVEAFDAFFVNKALPRLASHSLKVVA